MESRIDPFEGFQPTTATEVALWNEVKRLQYALLKAGAYPSMLSVQPVETIPCDILPSDIRIPWTARVIGFMQPGGYLCVRMQARYGQQKSDQFGSQYMISPLERLSKFQAADHALELHKQQLHQVAAFLTGDAHGK